MNLPLKIALRYLFSKKSHSAINTISIISVCGVAITTMALICTLSVYNGFQDLVSSLYSTLDPEVSIEPARGKSFDITNPKLDSLARWEEIAIFSPTIEGNALISYQNKQMAVTLKGVEDNYALLTSIDSILYDGEFKLKDPVANYATLGVGVANQVGAGARYVHPISVYAPKRKAKVNTANPASSFNQGKLFATAVFGVNQVAYDNQLVIVPLSFTQQMFNYDTERTAVELKLREGVNAPQVIGEIRTFLGDDFLVKDRLQQQETSFNMMQIEKWMTFLILAFIILIASFNVVGSLTMLIIDKKEHITTLRHLGASERTIKQIFLYQGWLISALGAGGGLLLGVIICLVQQQYGILSLGSGSGQFIVDAYPVRVEMLDVCIVAFTVSFLGLFTSWFPVRTLRSRGK